MTIARANPKFAFALRLSKLVGMVPPKLKGKTVHELCAELKQRHMETTKELYKRFKHERLHPRQRTRINPIYGRKNDL